MGDGTPTARAFGPEQRIGRRVPAGGLRMDWHPSVPERRRLGARSTRREPTAEVIDLSVSGAKVVIVENDQLHIGCQVSIGMDGGWGTAAVRRVEEGPGHASVYGIHFLQLDARLRDTVNRLA